MAARAYRPTIRSNRPRLPAHPNYYFERKAWSAGLNRVAGVDEAGRGAWAGPIVAAAVSLPADPQERRSLSRALAREGVKANDSKLLTIDERDIIVDVLSKSIAEISFATASPDEIDQYGIGYVNARLLRDAAVRLTPTPDYVLSDAFLLPDFGSNQRAIVHGDRRSVSIAHASCVAKVTRDRLMLALDVEFPGYGFAQHKGYGTPAHRKALERLGPSPAHRRSFAPVRQLGGYGA